MQINLPQQALQQLQPILNTVSTNLERNRIELRYLDQFSDETNIVLTIDHLDSIFLNIEIFTPEKLTASPILYSQYDLQTQILRKRPNHPLSPDEVQNVASFLTALSLYSIKRCDLAQPFFEEFDLLSVAEWGLPFNFYRGNCAVIDNELETAASFYDNAMYFADNVSASVAANTNFAWTLMQLPIDKRHGFQVNDLDGAIWLSVCVKGFCDPVKEVESFKRRAQLYALNADYDKAIESLNSALTRVNRQQEHFYLYTNANLYTLRGQMYLNLYEWDNSLADYNTAIELDPDYAEAYFQRGVLYYSILQTGQELREEALADFRHYLELAPDGPYAAQAADYAQTIETELATLND